MAMSGDDWGLLWGDFEPVRAVMEGLGDLR